MSLLVGCPTCGNEVSKAARECPGCGHPIIATPAMPTHALPYVQTQRGSFPPLGSGTAIAGMLCGVGSLLLLFVPCAWLGAILPSGIGITISSVAFARIKRGEETGYGMAVAGILCGIVATLLYGLLWVIFQDALHEAFL